MVILSVNTRLLVLFVASVFYNQPCHAISEGHATARFRVAIECKVVDLWIPRQRADTYQEWEEIAEQKEGWEMSSSEMCGEATISLRSVMHFYALGLFLYPRWGVA